MNNREIVVDNFAGGGGASTGIEIAISKSEQVARCRNAVCPPIQTALVRANLPELCERKSA